VATLTLRNQYRQFDPNETRVLLFDGGTEPLAAFGPKLAKRAAKSLTAMGVEQHMGSIVTGVDELGLEVKGPDGGTERYDAGTVLWTAGVQAPELADRLVKRTGASQDRAGRIQVQPDLTLPEHPEIVVAGDLMSLDHLPGLAEVAMQSGSYAGHRIRRQVERRGSTQKPFRYRDLGSAAYISRGRAVVSLGPVHLSGFLGWLTWLGIHLAFLTTFRNRLTALLTWTVAFSRETRRERAITMAQMVPGRDLYDLAPTAADQEQSRT
jgi:NADH:ubiquinone reductase (H+-translocating)